MVKDKSLSLKEAANHLGVSILDLISMSKNEGIPFQIVEGKVYYSQDDLIKEEIVQPAEKETLETVVQPPSRAPRRKLVTENKPRQLPLTPEDFTINYINQVMKEKNQNGAHVRYDGYNDAFRKQFPGLDPIFETQRMRDKGLIRMYRAKGGAKIYLPLENVVENVDQYNYANKNEWRNQWFEFQKRNIELDENSKVLYLGGYGGEVNGYLELGVPLKNQVVVENDPLRVSHLKREFSGLNLKNEDLLDYLASTDDKFDTILLDFDGSLTEKKLRALEIIIRKQILKEKSVLGVNFFANREADATKMLYLQPYLEERLESVLGEQGFMDEIPDQVLDKKNLNGHRDYGITSIVLKMLMGRDSCTINGALLNSLPKTEREKMVHELEKNPPQNFIEYIKANDQLMANLENVLKEENINKYLSLALIACHSRPYFVGDMKRISYKTKDNNVNHFFSDFYALEQRRDLCESLNEEPVLSQFVSGQQNVSWLASVYQQMNPKKRNRLNRIVRYVGERINPEYISFIIYNKTIPNRQKIPKTSQKQSLTIDEAFELFNRGYSSKEVCAMYPRINMWQIAGYKGTHTTAMKNKD